MRFSSRLRRALVLFAASGLVVAPAAMASTSASGRVTRVVDGDTVAVDVYGDATATPKAVRNAGIQTMELGQCHAAQASASMSQLTANKIVTVSAASASSTNIGRLLRFVDVPSSTGAPVDAQLVQIQRGHALWYPLAPEQGRSYTYHVAMEQAIVAGQNLWSPTFCGSGPQQTAKLKIYINYDADGADHTNVNGEWVRILNQSAFPVSLGGWWIRSANPDSYFLPAGTVVQPGGTLTLSVGKGTNTSTWKHWGFSGNRFQNLDVPGAVGGAAFLFDPQGDIRAQVSYPCVYRCTDPAIGKVHMTVTYDAPGDDYQNVNGEVVTISSLGPAVDLSYRVLQIGGSTRDFGPGTVIRPGYPLHVHIGKGRSGYLTKYWNRPTPILPNTGGAMVLRSSEGVRIACTAWASGRC